MLKRGFTLALLGLFAALPAAAADYPLIGEAAPDFALRAFTASNVRLSESRGQVVVLSFFSSRCNPCRAQLAQLDSVYRTYRPAGLTVYGISVDDDKQQAKDFATSVAAEFPLLADPTKLVGREYDIATLPTIVIIDRVGVVRYVYRDPRTRGEPVYVGQLRRLLDE